jgi:hypothetical protein
MNMKKLLTLLDGKKTYLVALAMAAYAILGLALGKLDSEVAYQLMLEAAAFAGLRKGLRSGK